MKLLIFFPLFLFYTTFTSAQQDSSFLLTHQQSITWKADSTGKQGDRYSIYRSVFFKEKEGYYRKFLGVTKDATVAFLGPPNKTFTHSGNDEQYTYFVNWKGREYVELTLEISFKEGRICDFGFYIID
jgi:hypothetical protein